MINKPAPRQFRCLKIIRNVCAKNERPTRSYLGSMLGISRVSAHLLVQKLKLHGYVFIIPGGWGNVAPTEKGWAAQPADFTIEALRARDSPTPFHNR